MRYRKTSALLVLALALLLVFGAVGCAYRSPRFKRRQNPS